MELGHCRCSRPIQIPAEEEAESLETEEEQDEEEGEGREPFEGIKDTTISMPGESSKGQASKDAGGPIVCDNFFGYPHPSRHKKTRVNVVTEVDCSDGPVSGSVRSILYENGRIVRDSGERKFDFPLWG
jgi:hypothetical protein